MDDPLLVSVPVHPVQHLESSKFNLETSSQDMNYHSFPPRKNSSSPSPLREDVVQLYLLKAQAEIRAVFLRLTRLRASCDLAGRAGSPCGMHSQVLPLLCPVEQFGIHLYDP